MNLLFCITVMTVVSYIQTIPAMAEILLASRMKLSAYNELYNEIIDGGILPLLLRSKTLCGSHSGQHMIF